MVTVYKENSHADVIVGKILEGFSQDGGEGPGLKLVSLFVDQVPKNDMSRALARKHGFQIADSIDGALTLGQNKLAVSGVLRFGIGEKEILLGAVFLFAAKSDGETTAGSKLREKRSPPSAWMRWVDLHESRG